MYEVTLKVWDVEIDRWRTTTLGEISNIVYNKVFPLMAVGGDFEKSCDSRVLSVFKKLSDGDKREDEAEIILEPVGKLICRYVRDNPTFPPIEMEIEIGDHKAKKVVASPGEAVQWFCKQVRSDVKVFGTVIPAAELIYIRLCQGCLGMPYWASGINFKLICGDQEGKIIAKIQK